MDKWFNQNANSDGWITGLSPNNAEYTAYIPSNVTSSTKIVLLGCSFNDYYNVPKYCTNSNDTFVNYIKTNKFDDTIYMIVSSKNLSDSSNYANMLLDVADKYNIPTNNINVCSYGEGNIITSKISEVLSKSGKEIGTYLNVMGDINEDTSSFQENYSGEYYHVNDHSSIEFKSEAGIKGKNEYNDPKKFTEIELEAINGNDHNFYAADKQLKILSFLSGKSSLNIEENNEYFSIKGVKKHEIIYEDENKDKIVESNPVSTNNYTYTPTYSQNLSYKSNQNVSYKSTTSSTNKVSTLGSIKYDREKTNEAIIYIKKAVTGLEKVKENFNRSSSTLPANSLVPSLLNKLSDNLSSNLDNAVNAEQVLQSMQDAAEKMTDDEYIKSVSKELQGAGFKLIDGYISKDGIPGLIYVPSNRQNIAGLPLITYLPAAGRSKDKLDARNYGLGKIAESGYNLDSGIFLPIGDSNSWDFNSNSRKKLYNTIMEVATMNKVDMSRLSLVGASLGGEIGFELCAEHPNTFASLTTFISSEVGGYVFNHANEIANSGTTFIVYVNRATRDQYQILNSAGAKIIGYDVGIGDDDNVNRLYSKGLLTDISNIQKGTNYLKNGNQLISVSNQQINDWSILYELSKNKGDLSRYGVDKETDSYYVSLTNR